MVTESRAFVQKNNDRFKYVVVKNWRYAIRSVCMNMISRTVIVVNKAVNTNFQTCNKIYSNHQCLEPQHASGTVQ